jgi:hypothetical protein
MTRASCYYETGDVILPRRHLTLSFTGRVQAVKGDGLGAQASLFPFCVVPVSSTSRHLSTWVRLLVLPSWPVLIC